MRWISARSEPKRWRISALVINTDKGLTLLLHQFHTGLCRLLRLGLFVAPSEQSKRDCACGLSSIVLPGLMRDQLGEGSVLDITIIGGFVGVHVRSESEFYEFGICQIVEREEVGAGFFMVEP